MQPSRARVAVVVIPGGLNYFYDLVGRRLAEALHALGWNAEIRTARDLDGEEADLAVLCNVSEILIAGGGEAAALPRLRDLRKRVGRMASLGIDCVATPWYARLAESSDQVGADILLDLGLHPQQAAGDQSPSYRFLFSGLTPSESEALSRLGDDPGDRPIPWAFVGHLTESRAALVDDLIRHVHPGGFVYMPGLAPYVEEGSPHLNQRQFEQVLSRSVYQVWCSHHEHFYMEPERFRTSLLTGGAPLKVVSPGFEPPAGAPFAEFLVPWDELHRASKSDLSEVVALYRRRWRAMPTLCDGLADLLADLGLASPVPLSRAG